MHLANGSRMIINAFFTMLEIPSDELDSLNVHILSFFWIFTFLGLSPFNWSALSSLRSLFLWISLVVDLASFEDMHCQIAVGEGIVWPPFFVCMCLCVCVVCVCVCMWRSRIVNYSP